MLIIFFIETINDIKQNKKMVLLDILLKTKINDYLLTDADIKEEVDTFMFEVNNFNIRPNKILLK